MSTLGRFNFLSSSWDDNQETNLPVIPNARVLAESNTNFFTVYLDDGSTVHLYALDRPEGAFIVFGTLPSGSIVRTPTAADKTRLRAIQYPTLAGANLRTDPTERE